MKGLGPRSRETNNQKISQSTTAEKKATQIGSVDAGGITSDHPQASTSVTQDHDHPTQEFQSNKKTIELDGLHDQDPAQEHRYFSLALH